MGSQIQLPTILGGAAVFAVASSTGSTTGGSTGSTQGSTSTGSQTTTGNSTGSSTSSGTAAGIHGPIVEHRGWIGLVVLNNPSGGLVVYKLRNGEFDLVADFAKSDLPQLEGGILDDLAAGCS